MKRKTKEIALLTAPVVAIAALVPGVRMFNNWREANKVPRVEACYFRKPTPKEARQGADVGYTVRFVVPDSGGPFWAYKIDFSNAKGGHWISGTPAWNRIVVASAERDWCNPDFITCGDADNRKGGTTELTGGFKWKNIAGKSANIQAEISLLPDESAHLGQVKASRVFTLKKLAPLPK